jgi:hypothetical protein
MTRLLYVALGTLASLAGALALAVGAFLSGLDVDGEFLRAPLERALTAAFDVPTRLEGPLRLRTGPAATVSAEALVLADPSGPAGATLARGIAPRARIDLLALLRRAVLLEEVGGERLELALRRNADGQANWEALFSSTDASSPVSFAGIERLRIDAVVGSYRRGDEPPVPFSIAAFDGAVPLDDPLRASGTAQIAGQEIGFDLRTAPLAKLASTVGVPLTGSVTWSGAQAKVDGALLDGGRRLDAAVDASAADAVAALAALGIAANDPGPLALRGRITATTAQLSVRDLEASLGQSKAAGSATFAWGGPAPAIAIDLTGERLDAAPFLGGTPRSKGTRAAEDWVARLERLATATEVSATLAVEEVTGLAVSANKVRLDLRSGERTLAAKAAAVVAGTAVEATLDYDARKPRHTLTARIDSGAASTRSLPSEARPSELAFTAGGIRAELHGEGADPAALVASLQGSFDARGVDWTFGRGRTQPIRGRFDAVRIALHGTKASSAEVSGRIEGAACGMKISGGTAAALLAGEPWPVRFSANCPNERINANGRIALAERHATADLAFDLAGDRSGPVARAMGLPPALPYPLAARGTLVLDGRTARLRLAAVRLGRTAGSGEIDHPFAADGTLRLRLALTTLDLDGLGAAPVPDTRPADPLERRLLPSDLRLPDADFDVAAERVAYGDARLRNFKFAGSVRGRRIRPAPFEIEWDGMALRGRAGLDFSGVRPRVQIDATAQEADLRRWWLAAVGIEGVGVHAGQLSLSLQAQGERLRDLLASATLDASVARGQIELRRPLLPGGTGRGSVDATFRAAAGQPLKFTARGQMDGRQVDLTVDGPPVEALARDSAAVPLALRSTVGDVRLEADGRFARDGSGEARVRLAGSRLDDLGNLLGLPLPQVSPYEAGASVSVSPRIVDIAGLKASFGSSRVAGSIRIEQRDGGRAVYFVALHAPVLHLEDMGAGQWLDDRGPTARASAESTARSAQVALERLLDVLPRADVDASIELDAVLGGGQLFTSGQVVATVNAGRLRARLLDVRAEDGTANADLGIDASASPPRFSLRADARDVEYGALVRAMSPATQLNGQMDVIADLSAAGPPQSLLQAMQGTFDVAVYPRDMNASALGLWGAGLLPAILRAVERDSQAAVLCSVAGFAVADGVARSDGFFVETTRVRIIGDVEVNLGNWEISGRIDPRSNTPQLFAISPRMQIGGALGNPTLSVAPESLVLAPLRFASPLSLFARDWLGRGSRRAGGQADCRDAFERVLEAHHGQAGSR